LRTQHAAALEPKRVATPAASMAISASSSAFAFRDGGIGHHHRAAGATTSEHADDAVAGLGSMTLRTSSSATEKCG